MSKVSDLTSLNLEKQIISSLLEYPDVLFDMEHILESNCFANLFHSCCFSILKDSAKKKEKIDKNILSQRLINIGLAKYEELDSFSYIDSISYNKLSDKEVTKTACEELIKLKKLRDLLEQNSKVEKYILDNKDKNLDVICSQVDKLNNEIIQKYENKSSSTNIFSNIKQVIEERADNPPKNFLFGPFKTINEIYGTLLPPACLNLIGARSGVSKTALSMFYLLHIAEKYDLPILHCDFSEMTMEQLQFRAISAFTNGIVPYYALVRGTWRKNSEWQKLVRQVYPRVEKLKMFYFDVGSMTELQQISLMRRIYNREIKGKFGGDKEKELLLLNYDYLKPFDSTNLHNQEWKVMGKWIMDYKSLVNNELPQIRGWFSLQVNRLGITNNKSTKDVDDSENTFTMSDRIMQQATSAFLIRQKLHDEITVEGNRFGNLKMIPLKFREVLGDQWERHFNWIKTHEGKYKKNYVNLNMKSFFFEDKSDAQSVESFLANQINVGREHQVSDINI